MYLKYVWANHVFCIHSAAAVSTEADIADANEIDLDGLDDDMDQCTDATAALVSEAFASGVAADDNEIVLVDEDNAPDAEELTAKTLTTGVTDVTDFCGSGVTADDNEIDLASDDSADEKVAAKPLPNIVPKRKRIKLPPPVNSLNY